MIGYIILCFICVGIFVVSVQCVRISRQQEKIIKNFTAHDRSLATLDSMLRVQGSNQESMNKRISQLSTDVLQKEIYQSADDRHAMAIDSARQGKPLFEIMQLHGLSSDEAALIISLHAPMKETSKATALKNANLAAPSRAELV